jgi:hypothetical protein
MSQAPDLVECYSGGEYAERPRVLYWQGMRLEIIEIEGRWLTPAGKRFRVRTEDGQLFELFYGMATDAWSIDLIA